MSLNLPKDLYGVTLELHLPEKSGGEGSFGLVCCLDRADGTGEGGLTGGGDMGIRGGVTVGVGAVIS